MEISPASAPTEARTLPLDELSEQLQISKQTLVRWVDRHLVEASLGWALTNEDEELRVIELSNGAYGFLQSLSADYRSDVVSRKQARRILKKIDAKKIKKMVRAGHLETVEVDGEVRIIVGSIEDYLIGAEGRRSEVLS